jgi:hypothetical protein
VTDRYDRYATGYDPYRMKRRLPPAKRTREVESIFAMPFVEVPPRGTAHVTAHAQGHFRAKRFCIYADDASKLRVELYFGTRIGASGPGTTLQIPAGLFSDGPTVDRTAFVLHCSECGAPTKDGAPKCGYCGAPFTWRLTETAFGMSGLALDFPPLSPGVCVDVKFTSRSDKAIGVDAAFIGLTLYEEPCL